MFYLKVIIIYTYDTQELPREIRAFIPCDGVCYFVIDFDVYNMVSGVLIL